MSELVLAIDGTNRVHVLWHVLHDARRVAEKFTRDVESLVREIRPSQVVLAFDSPTCFRRDLYPAYKLGRAAKEQGLRDTLDLTFSNSLDVFSTLQIAGFEADDILATVAAECGQRCVIASPDKDLRQCLYAGRVTILKGWSWFDSRVAARSRFAPEWLTADELERKYGVGPDQWIDYQCLVGDPGDGIKGADGIGEKTAGKILFECGTLAAAIENRWASSTLAKSERLWAAVKELESRLPVVRQLLTLRTDVPSVAELLREVARA